MKILSVSILLCFGFFIAPAFSSSSRPLQYASVNTCSSKNVNSKVTCYTLNTQSISYTVMLSNASATITCFISPASAESAGLSLSSLTPVIYTCTSDKNIFTSNTYYAWSRS